MISVDGQILLFIQEHIRNAVGDVFFGGITHLGDAGIFWIVLTIVLLWEPTHVADRLTQGWIRTQH